MFSADGTQGVGMLGNCLKWVKICVEVGDTMGGMMGGKSRRHCVDSRLPGDHLPTRCADAKDQLHVPFSNIPPPPNVSPFITVFPYAPHFSNEGYTPAAPTVHPAAHLRHAL